MWYLKRRHELRTPLRGEAAATTSAEGNAQVAIEQRMAQGGFEGAADLAFQNSLEVRGDFQINHPTSGLVHVQTEDVMLYFRGWESWTHDNYGWAAGTESARRAFPVEQSGKLFPIHPPTLGRGRLTKRRRFRPICGKRERCDSVCNLVRL